MSPWVRIGGPGGVPATAIARDVSEIEVTHEWPEGGTSLAFTMLLAPSERPPQVHTKALVDLMVGARPVWAGYLSEVDWASGRMVAKGSIGEGDSTPCLAVDGRTTSIPNVAIDTAITRGEVTWRRGSSISASAYGDAGETEKLNSVTELLVAYQTEADKRIYVDPTRTLLIASDPVAPSFHLLPGTDELSWATEAQADRLIGRYQSTPSGSYANVTATAPGAQAPYTVRMLDMSPRGVLSAARATAILNGILTDVASGGWAGGFDVTSYQIAGAPDLSAVSEAVGRGAMFRKLGQRDPRPGRVPVGYIDFVCGQSVWRPLEDKITLTPIGTVARDWAAILQENGLGEAA